MVPKAYAYEELSLYSDDPIEKIREVWNWGTYGKDGDQPLTRVLLKDMSMDHMEAMLDQPLYAHVHSLLKREIFHRKLVCLLD